MIHLKKQKKEDTKNNFSLLFTCLSMIILTFFIFLTVNSNISPEKKKIAIGSLVGSFGLLKTNYSPIYSKNEKNIGFHLIDIGHNKNITEGIKKIISKLNLESYIYITQKNGNLIIKARGKIAFKKGTDTLNKAYLVLLNRIYNYLSDVINLKIKIIAYPDKFLTSEFISPFDLASHRAFKIAIFFEKRGINIKNIEAFGKGIIPKDNTKVELIISGEKYVKKRINNKINIKGIEFKVD